MKGGPSIGPERGKLGQVLGSQAVSYAVMG
jgi:hypothetical protein